MPRLSHCTCIQPVTGTCIIYSITDTWIQPIAYSCMQPINGTWIQTITVTCIQPITGTCIQLITVTCMQPVTVTCNYNQLPVLAYKQLLAPYNQASEPNLYISLALRQCDITDISLIYLRNLMK
jgi:hypothetical protein